MNLAYFEKKLQFPFEPESAKSHNESHAGKDKKISMSEEIRRQMAKHYNYFADSIEVAK